MAISNMMIHTVDIMTEAQTKSGTGFTKTTLTSKATNIAARVTDQTPDRAMLIYGKFDATRQKRIYFDTDQSLVPVTDWITFDGKDYQITSVLNQGGNLDRLWAVDVELLPVGGS